MNIVDIKRFIKGLYSKDYFVIYIFTHGNNTAIGSCTIRSKAFPYNLDEIRDALLKDVGKFKEIEVTSLEILYYKKI